MYCSAWGFPAVGKLGVRALGPYAGLFAVPGAKVYFGSQLVSQVGAAVFELGAVWFTLRLTQSPVITAVVAASAILPALVSPFAGLLSDVASPKRVLLAIDVIRALMALGLGAYVFVAGFPPAAVVVGFSLVLGLLTRVYLPAKFAWLGAEVPDEFLAHANALGSIISNLRLPFGGLVAAVVLAQDDPALIFLFSGVAYLASWALLLGLPSSSAGSAAGGGRGRGNVLGQAGAVLLDERLSVSLAFVAASNLVLVGAWIIGSPLLADRIAPESGLYAFMQAAYGVGIVGGSLLVAGLSARPGAMRRVISGGYVVRAVAFVGLLLAGTRMEATLGALVLGVATPALTVTFPTVLQRLSRVIGSAGTIFGLHGLANAGAVSVSIMVYGLVAAVLAPPPMFVIPVAGSLLAAVVVQRSGRLGFLSSNGEPDTARSV